MASFPDPSRRRRRPRPFFGWPVPSEPPADCFLHPTLFHYPGLQPLRPSGQGPLGGRLSYIPIPRFGNVRRSWYFSSKGPPCFVTPIIESLRTPARIIPFPTGRLTGWRAIPGTSCQATFATSLRDISQQPLVNSTRHGSDGLLNSVFCFLFSVFRLLQLLNSCNS